MLDLVDRSDEVLVGTSRDRTVGREETGGKSTVQCGPVGGDARYARSVRGVPWQPNPAEVPEGESVSVARIGRCSIRAVSGSSGGAKRVPSASVLRPPRSGACEVRRFRRLLWMQRTAAPRRGETAQ